MSDQADTDELIDILGAKKKTYFVDLHFGEGIRISGSFKTIALRIEIFKTHCLIEYHKFRCAISNLDVSFGKPSYWFVLDYKVKLPPIKHSIWTHGREGVGSAKAFCSYSTNSSVLNALELKKGEFLLASGRGLILVLQKKRLNEIKHILPNLHLLIVSNHRG